MFGVAVNADFDPDQLREKYRIEREKRLRVEGSAQYRAPDGALSSYVDDPYTPYIEREPVTDDMEAVVVGGGFGGLLTAARMREAGLKDIRVVEQGGDFGGTWYWNRYPGAACDTDAYIYLPLLEETGYMPSEKYAKGPEIFEHSKRVARHYDLYTNALLQTAVTDLTWSDADSRWIVTTNRGDVFRARFVAVTAGQMMKPKLPGVPGIEEFKGHSFHTTRWDYEYTGGDSTGGMTGLTDKRVGIVGTGATSIQAVPHLGASAGEVYVFQRTPSAVNVRANKLTDPEWVASLKPGWQRDRMENFSTFVAGGDAETDLVNDGWTAIYRARTLTGGVLDEKADFQKMEEVRARVDSIVTDVKVAEALKPYYRALCKRPTFHDEYLATFNRPNVTLVDTDGQGLEKVTERGIVAGGVEYELDCIIFASGFQIGGPFTKRVGFEIRGRGGQALSDAWKTGISTFYGMQTHNFPNLFIVATNQVGISSNQGHVLDVQSRHIRFLVQETLERNATEIDVTVDAQDEWVAEVIRGARSNEDFLKSCTPGYYNNEGQPNIHVAQRNGAYAPGIMAFDRMLDEWRSDRALPGLVFGGVK
ncbi:NAD(P)/FAD-dependent oxidoreductase [Rhodococcus sp. KBS0724]|uniref:flavin-containing monooxygenase n=1 Tax=Rhodococcus sp. KBS0724 TaxID=1179674 RepID=UPI00110F13EB|nr:NAD(P)/FAD-dependent oxidoreductase [Rhodococcus sp. KBS0724]TSD40358.1 NAD(P)/FAD-dependent oxidoreductase [Rhodococcus sp. KBS0724]